MKRIAKIAKAFSYLIFKQDMKKDIDTMSEFYGCVFHYLNIDNLIDII